MPIFYKPYTHFVLLALLLSLLSGVVVQAQVGRPPVPQVASAGGDKVELIRADTLVGINQPGATVRKLKNNVALKQKGVLMYCDLAIQNQTTNVIEAYGNVRMVQGDTITVQGDTMFYYGNARQANLRGRVVMKDRKMTLNTKQLDYDMLTGIAHYPVKGRIVDRENILTSDEGFYDTRIKQFTFRRNVRLLNQPTGKEKTTIIADSLLYNSVTRLATFQGPTKIISKDGTLQAKEGQYNTVSRISNFQRRATVETDKYTLTGDTLNFDNLTDLGLARGHVVLVSKSDRTILTGDHGRYNGQAGVSRITGHAVVKSIVSQDTLFMRADTLFSFDGPGKPGAGKPAKGRRLVGQKNVLVYKSDLQSKCDSIVYDLADSTIYFYKKPIIWSQNNYQMEADSMKTVLIHNRINTMYLRGKSFVVSQDTLRNFNQVKGRVITAFFRDMIVKPASLTATTVSNRKPASRALAKPTKVKPQERTELDRVVVEGNGQSIYFAVDEKSRMIGLNHVECSKMTIEFNDRKVDRIRFYGHPDAAFVPPHEMTTDRKQLDGFRWRDKDKPTKAQVLASEPASPTQPAKEKPASTDIKIDQPYDKNGIKIDASVKPLVPRSVQTIKN